MWDSTFPPCSNVWDVSRLGVVLTRVGHQQYTLWPLELRFDGSSWEQKSFKVFETQTKFCKRSCDLCYMHSDENPISDAMKRCISASQGWKVEHEQFPSFSLSPFAAFMSFRRMGFPPTSICTSISMGGKRQNARSLFYSWISQFYAVVQFYAHLQGGRPLSTVLQRPENVAQRYEREETATNRVHTQMAWKRSENTACVFSSPMLPSPVMSNSPIPTPGKWCECHFSSKLRLLRWDSQRVSSRFTWLWPPNRGWVVFEPSALQTISSSGFRCWYLGQEDSKGKSAAEPVQRRCI